MSHILVLEDEADVRELLTLHLKREGYSVSEFEDAELAFQAIQEKSYDLYILDWMLPKMSGLDICKKMRTQLKNTKPILMLTARADTMDKVLGLEIGADDYLTKPFEIKEFVARVRALLRRSLFVPAENLNSEEQIAGVFILKNTQKKIFLNKQELNLTPNEFKLLSTLIQKKGVTFERSDLIKLIQGPGVAVVDRTIDTTVLGLRKKLGNYADHVETVRGFGYRLRE